MATATVGALRVVLGLDSAAFTEGLTAAQKHLRGVGRQMQTVGTNMAQIGAGITAAVTAPIAALGITFTKAAIDAQEMQSAFDVSFGKMSQSTREWAETTGDAMGRSTFELQKMALGFNGLFKTGGPVTAQTVEMSKRFTQLAQDLSSFHNVAEEDAFQALRSGLSGEAEPLRRFNVYLTEASVQAEAMRLGLAKAGEEVSEQAKIQARASLIMKGTTEAQGDVIRTSAGTQNQIRALKSQWAELSVTLGTAILPVLTPIVSKLNEMAKSFSGLSPAMQQGLLIFGGIAALVGPALIAFGAIVSSIGAVVAAFGAGGVLAGLPALLGPIGIAAAVVAAAFIVWGDELVPALKAFGAAVIEAVGPTIAPLMGTAKKLFSDFGALVGQLFGGSGGGDLTKAMTFFGETVGQIFAGVISVATGLIGGLSNIFRAIGALLRGDWSTMWNALGSAVATILGGVWRAFEQVAPKTTEAMRRLYEGVRTWLLDRLGGIFTAAINKVRSVGDAFHDLYIRVVGNSDIPDLVSEVGVWMAKLQQTLVDPAEKATKAAGDRFEELRDRVRGIMQGLLTEDERAWLEHQANVKGLKDTIAAGGADADAAQHFLARENARYAGRDLRPIAAGPSLTPIAEMPGVQAVNDTMQRINQEIDASRERFADAFSYGIEAALRGDWSSILRMVVGDTFNDALRGMGRSIFNSSGAGSGGLLSTIGRSIGGLFGKLPGFATGGSFKVGGAGGIDSKLVAFRATPGEMVNIRRPGQDMARGPMQVEVTPSKYFDVRVRSAAQPMVAQGGVQAVQASRKIVPAEQGRKQRYSFS